MKFYRMWLKKKNTGSKKQLGYYFNSFAEIGLKRRKCVEKKWKQLFFYEPKSRRSVCNCFHFSCALFTLAELLFSFFLNFICIATHYRNWRNEAGINLEVPVGLTVRRAGDMRLWVGLPQNPITPRWNVHSHLQINMLSTPLLTCLCLGFHY